jgi:hypothetical protein
VVKCASAEATWASASCEPNDSSRKILVADVIGPICQCPLNPRDFIPSDTIRRVVDQQLWHLVDKVAVGNGFFAAYNKGSSELRPLQATDLTK